MPSQTSRKWKAPTAAAVTECNLINKSSWVICEIEWQLYSIHKSMSELEWKTGDKLPQKISDKNITKREKKNGMGKSVHTIKPLLKGVSKVENTKLLLSKLSDY